jgi:hypothetical protein
MVAAVEDIHMELVIAETLDQWELAWVMLMVVAQAEEAVQEEIISTVQAAEAAEQATQDKMQLIQHCKMDVVVRDTLEDLVGVQEHQVADMVQIIAGHLGLVVVAQEALELTVLQAAAEAAAEQVEVDQQAVALVVHRQLITGAEKVVTVQAQAAEEIITQAAEEIEEVAD